MNWINEILPYGVIEAFGWSFFHSLWIGGLIALLLGSVLLFVNQKNARVRYNLSVAAIMLFVLAVGYVFCSNLNSSKTGNSSFNVNSQSMNLIDDSNASINMAADNSISEDIYSTVKNYFQRNFSLVVTLWMIGLLMFSLRFIGGVLVLQKLRTRGIVELDVEWFYRARELSRKLKISLFVPIYESLNATVPIAVGFFKPVILLPIGMINGLPYTQVEAIITHELAHIKRYDYLVNAIQCFIETIFFYHPAIWWISSRIRDERENCCDDMVLGICSDSLVYSKALYNLQSRNSDQPSLALAATKKENQLLRRIKRMNGEKKKLSYWGRFAAFIFVFIVIGAAVVVSSASETKKHSNVFEASFVNPISSEEISSAVNKFSLHDTTSIKKGKRSLTFYDDFNGEEKRFKVKLNDGKLQQLFVDGEEIQPKDFEKYEKRIGDRVEEYDTAVKEYNQQMGQYKENMKKFREEMNVYREKMKKFRGIHTHDFDFDFDFDLDVPTHVSVPPINIPSLDSSEWKRIMEDVQHNVNEHLANRSIVIPPIHIPKIHVPKVHIPPIHIPKIDIPEIDLDEMRADLRCSEFDKEEFKKDMEKWKDEFSVEMKKFSEEMKKEKWNNDEFKKSMKELGKNMDKLKVEMKSLKGFLKETKEELINDKLISEGDDLDGFYLSKDEMKIDGKKVSPDLHKKYLEIYKKHYDKELTGDQKFQIND